jgi:early endosome antigen 1
MTYEPRSRGIRSRRTSTKKSSREKKNEQREAYFYEEPVPVDREQLSAKVMNSLEHLGSQRFALSPFAEHFRRWIKDLNAVLTEFTTSIPEAADEEYKLAASKLLADINTELEKRIEAEKRVESELSELQHQLSTCELEISNVEQEQRKRREDMKRDYERSKRQLQSEINALDRHRLALIKKKPSLLERLFGTPKAGLEESASKIQSRKDNLVGKEKGLQNRLENLRSGYSGKRRELDEREKILREKLTGVKSTSVDDALEMRRDVCRALGQAVASSLERLEARSKEENAQ